MLNEILFEYRGRIKQNRLNKFTELLSDFFKDNSKINLEDFSDLLEAILKRVVDTKSEEKLKRFRDVLINGLNNQINYENTEPYLDLVKSLSEIEINILSHHSPLHYNFEDRNGIIRQESYKLELSQMEDEIEKGNRTVEMLTKYSAQIDKIRVLESRCKSIESYRKSDFYKISEDDFLYYKQKLFSLGLLIDSGLGIASYRPFERMSITEYAKKFLLFISKA